MGKKTAPDVEMRRRDEASTACDGSGSSSPPPHFSLPDGNVGLLLHSAATWNANEGGGV